jgi:hypothetical protein
MAIILAVMAKDLSPRLVPVILFSPEIISILLVASPLLASEFVCLL